MKVLVMTSDKYLPALLPFAWLMQKYWHPAPEVVVCGFTAPNFGLPDNFRFVSLGNFSDYPFGRWSDAFIKALNVVDDEAPIVMLEDYWIVRQVDTVAVQVLYDYARQFHYVAKIDLCGDRLYAHGADCNYGHVAHLDLVKSMPGSPYHLSLMPGIWRKEHLLRHVVPNESPHDLELIGTTRLSHDQNVLVLGTRQWPLRITLGLRGGDSNHINLGELDPTDVSEMRALGFFEPWEGG